MARYTSTESHVDTVFRITVDHDLENEMMVLSCDGNGIKVCLDLRH